MLKRIYAPLPAVSLVFSLFALSACSGPGQIKIPPASSSVDCSQSTTLEVPSDPAEHGPWPVGAKTVQLSNGHGKLLRTEIWYPAVLGSESGLEKEKYQLKQFLPAADAAKIPDSVNTLQDCDCYRDLPLDSTHGPYPAIVFIHGTASFRTASLTQAVHWASRGFIVIAADHLHIQLKELKNNFLGALAATQARDAANIIKQLHDSPAAIDFLKTHIDLNRIGVGGHSAGGFAAGTLANIPGVRVIIPMAGAGVRNGTNESSLIMAAADDKIVRYSMPESGYKTTPAPKRFVSLSNAGHLAFTDICALLPDQGGIIQVAEDNGVKVPYILKTLGRDGCGSTQLPPQTGWEIINYASTAAFEEKLQCKPESSDYLLQIKSRFAEVADYKQQL